MMAVSVRPLMVKLRWKPTSLIAGEEYVITCDSQGSRPPAVLSWWINENKFESEKVSRIIYSSIGRNEYKSNMID